MLSTSLFVSCYPLNKSAYEDISETQIQANVDFSNKYIYLNSDNSLCLKDIYSEDVTILSKDVLEFKKSNEYLIFINKDYDGKRLKSLDLRTGNIETLKDYYNEDFLVQNEYLFYLEDNKICKLNLNSKESEELVVLTTNDVVLNLVNDNVLVFSYMERSIPTTFSYDLNKKTSKKVATSSSNIVYLDGALYGLDSNLNIFKVNSDNTLDTISNYPVLKFTIDKDYMVYIDVNGSLITLDSKGNKRVIADSATDFKRIDNNLYYISASSKNTLFETQLTGRHKKAITNDSSPTLNIDLTK